MRNYFYRTNNIINGKFYYGSHNGEDVNYLGSGVALKRAIKKYGIENFELIILKRFNTREEAYVFEERFLKLYKISSLKNSYNIKDAGIGGDVFTNNPNNKAIRNLQSEVHKRRFENFNERSKCNVFKDVSEERRKELSRIWSKASSGRLNGRAKKIVANGKLYYTIKEAAEDLNLTRMQVRYRLSKEIFKYIE